MVDLGEAASEFAQEVQDVLDAVLPGVRHVKAVQLNDRYVVRPEGPSLAAEFIPLTVRGAELAMLRVSFLCHVDHQGKYLAIEKSNFVLSSVIDRKPLVRLDFVRQSYRAPASHWQVHAERGAFSALLAHAGVNAPHDLASLHLPVGGSRMRPCLEDFLEFLVRECGVDVTPGWEDAVADGRERWRRRQVGTLVRDAPDEVVRVLEENGYRVDPPSSPLVPNVGKLRAW